MDLFAGGQQRSLPGARRRVGSPRSPTPVPGLAQRRTVEPREIQRRSPRSPAARAQRRSAHRARPACGSACECLPRSRSCAASLRLNLEEADHSADIARTGRCHAPYRSLLAPPPSSGLRRLCQVHNRADLRQLSKTQRSRRRRQHHALLGTRIRPSAPARSRSRSTPSPISCRTRARAMSAGGRR